MRVLAFDPGAERCGWACVDHRLGYLASGTLRHPREGREFQVYRLDLTRDIRREVENRLICFRPDHVVVETIPSHGSQGFVMAGQGYLANVVATTIHNVAIEKTVGVHQISARQWQAQIAKRGKTAKITKAQIRNGVLERLPHLRQELASSLNEWDRWDAIGIALFWLQ